MLTKFTETLLFLLSTLLVAVWYYVMDSIPTRTLPAYFGFTFLPLTSAPYVLWMAYDEKDRPERTSDRGFFLAFRVFWMMWVFSWFNLICVVLAVKLFSIVANWLPWISK